MVFASNKAGVNAFFFGTGFVYGDFGCFFGLGFGRGVRGYAVLPFSIGGSGLGGDSIGVGIGVSGFVGGWLGFISHKIAPKLAILGISSVIVTLFLWIKGDFVVYNWFFDILG